MFCAFLTPAGAVAGASRRGRYCPERQLVRALHGGRVPRRAYSRTEAALPALVSRRRVRSHGDPPVKLLGNIRVWRSRFSASRRNSDRHLLPGLARTRSVSSCLGLEDRDRHRSQPQPGTVVGSETASLSENVDHGLSGPSPTSGVDSGNNGGNGSFGKGNGGSGGRYEGPDEHGDYWSPDPEIAGVLRAYKRSLQSLPPEVVQAIQHGWIERRTLARYLAQDRGLVAWLLQWRFFRDRVLADPEFIFKLLAQEYIGNGTQLVGEFLVRGRELVDELEYVLSDLVVGTVVEASFVVLLAPYTPFPQMSQLETGAVQRGLIGSVWQRYLNWATSLPANAFEKSLPPLRVYTLPSRVLTVLHTSAQYFLIGFASGVVGTAITYGLLHLRKAMDAHYTPVRPMPPVLPNSIGWGAFMALSSNPRFQLVEGLERLSHMLFANHAVLNRSLIVSLRFLNNFYGGIHFVQFFRWAGLQATGQTGP